MAAAVALQSPLELVKTLQSWVMDNPHRKRGVPPIEIRTISDTQEGEDIPAAAAGGLVPTPLEPPGPVSLWLWKTNPEYRAGSAQIRRSMIREAILSLTERAEKELKGVRWSRKKVIEQLSAQQTAAVSPPMQTPELDAGLAHMLGYQKVLVDEPAKKISFVPADPRSWSAELPVWCSTTGGRAVLHRTGEESVGAGLAGWLSRLEDEGWRMDWPEADGTLEDLKLKMAQRGTSVRAGLVGKPKKADYAAAVGRAEAIAALSARGRGGLGQE